MKEKDEALTRLTKENIQLRNQFISMINTSVKSQNSNRIFVGSLPSENSREETKKN